MLRLQNINDIQNAKAQLPDIKTILQPNKFKKCHEVNLVGQSLKKKNNTTNMGMMNGSCVNITLQPLEIKTSILSW